MALVLRKSGFPRVYRRLETVLITGSNSRGRFFILIENFLSATASRILSPPDISVYTSLLKWVLHVKNKLF